MDNMSLGKYLKSIREQMEYSTHDISKLCDISQSYISLMENDKRKPSPIILKKLSNIYFLNYNDLLEKAGYEELINYDNNVSSSDINRKSKFYNIPVYGEIAAGQPNWAEECLEGYLPIDPNLMGILNPEEYYFLKVNGESMNKIVQNGSFALIHRQDYVENGDIAVVLVNGDSATLKRFSKENDIIVLSPESTDNNFKQQIYTKNTLIKVIGKYIGKMEINK